MSEAVPDPPDETGDPLTEEQRHAREVEAIIAGDILLPFLGWLLDADGRGAFNAQAIAGRVAGLAHKLNPSLLHGASARKVAERMGIDRSKLSRAVVEVTEQLGLANASTAEFQRAAEKSAQKFAGITRRKRRDETRSP